MANLTRYLQKIFAENSNQIGVFGTGVNKETSTNVETLQSAAYASGWSSAIITNKNYPIWQERDGVDYGFSYQLAYLLQKGIPDWIATETYYTNDYCKLGSDIYYSLQDNNIGQNPAGTTGYWKLASGADTDLSNLTTAGNARLQYAPFSINNGTVTNGENKTLSYSGSTLTCGDCTITTCDGRTKSFDTSATIDCSSEADGTYKVFKNYSNGALSLNQLITTTGSMPLTKISTANGYSFTSTNANMSGEGFFQGIIQGAQGTINSVTLTTTVPSGWSFTFDSYLMQGANGGMSPSSWNIKVNGTTLESRSGITVVSGEYVLDNPITVNSGDTLTVEISSFVATGGYWCAAGFRMLNVTGTYPDNNFFIGDANTIGAAYWLNTSTIPANFIIGGSVNNNLVYIGDVTVASNVITAVNNRQFNDSGYAINKYYLGEDTPHIVSSYVNGMSGYNIWSNKYCEQWGIVTSSSQTTVYLLKAYADTNYIILSGLIGNAKDYTPAFQSKTASSFVGGSTGSGYTWYWATKGYIA